jgi:hypothetical protein
MRLAPTFRRPVALLAATVLLTTGGVASGLLAGTASAAPLTITFVTNPVNSGNASRVEVDGNGASPGEPITVTITDGATTVPPMGPARVTTAGQDGAYSKTMIDVSGLVDGVLTVTASGQLSGTATRNIVKDTVPPVAPSALTTTPASTVNASQQRSVMVSAQAGPDANAVRLRIRDTGSGRLDRFPVNNSGTYTSTFDVTTLAEGTLTVEATAIDAAGNETTTSKTLTKDTLPPTFGSYAYTGVVASPNRVNASTPGPGNKVGVTVSADQASTYVVTITDSAGLVRTFIPVSTAPATTNSVSVDPYQFADGTLTLSTVTTDAAGNVGAAGTSSLSKDTTVPAVSGLKITPSPINNANKDKVIVSGKVVLAFDKATLPSESGTRVALTPTCSGNTPASPPLTAAGTTPAAQTVDMAADGTFSSGPFDTSGCIDGPQAFSVNAVASDPGGNVSPTANTKADRDIVAPANPTVTSLANALPANVTAVPFTGVAEAGSTVKVTIRDTGTKSVLVTVSANGSGNFSGTADVTTLDDGTITATATATDAAGNTGATSDPRTSNKDTTAFALVTATPSGTTGPNSQVQATYNEALNLASSSITVKTSPGNAPVAGNTSYANGNKTIIFAPTVPFTTGSYVATIVGKESGAGDDPAITTILNFTVDATAPNPPVINTLTSPVNNANKASVHAVGTAEPGSTVKVTLSNGTPNVVGTKVAGGDGSFDITLDSTSLPDGTLTAVATATDSGNNTSANSGAKTATKDVVAPTVSGTNATDTTQSAKNTTVTATSSESGNAVKVTLTDKNGATLTTDTTSGAMGAISVAMDASSLADGTITASVVATDTAGNPSAPGTKAFTKDATGPSVTNLAANNVNIAAAGKTTVTGTISEPGSVSVSVGDGTSSKQGTATAASDGTFTVTIDVSTLAEGNLTISAIGRDAKSNNGPPAGRVILKDTVKPVVSGLAATATTGTNNTTTVSGTTEPNASVRLTVTDGAKNDTKTVVAAGDGKFSTTFDLTGYKSGSLPVTAQPTDVAGNLGDAANATAARDATGPTINGLAATPTTGSTPATTVTGTVDDPKATVALKATDKNGLTRTGTATVSGSGSFTGTLDLSTLADGAIVVDAQGTDENGNVGALVTTSTSKDATAPAISGLAATQTTAAQPSTTVTGNVDDKAASVALKATDKNGLTTTGTANVNGSTGAFSGTLDLSTFADGTVTVQATGTDTSGNVGAPATVTFTKDGTAPMVSGLTATASNASQPNSSVNGTVDDPTATVGLVASDKNGATVSGAATVNGTTGAFAGSLDLSTLADGNISVKATATDAAGNSGNATVVTTRDSAAKPSTPAAPTATAGDKRATVSFVAPANGGAAISGYTVTASPGGATATGTASPITVTGLTNGTTYTFTVKATNRVGTSAASPPSNAVKPLGSATVTLNGLPRGVVFGTPITLSGTVNRTDTAVASGSVTIRVSDDNGTNRALRNLPTSNGAYSYRFTPSTNGTYTVVYNGDSHTTAGAISPGRRTIVAVKITASAPRGAASTPLVVKGSVSPNKPGRIVVLYRVGSGNSLKEIGRARIASNGSYQVSVRLARGNYTLQVGLGATPGNAAGSVRFTASRT